MGPSFFFFFFTLLMCLLNFLRDFCTYLARRPKHSHHATPCWRRIKKGDLLCFTSLLWCDSVHRSLHSTPTETQSFLTLSSLSHYLSPTIAATQHLSSHCSDYGGFRGEWGISLELRPRKQQEAPFRMASDGRGATWRGHAWLANPWQPSVFARWSIEGLCSRFCHGLPCCRFLAAGPLVYTTMASLLANSTPEQVVSRR